MDVIAIGRINYDSILPCLIAGIVGDSSGAVWGIHHNRYHIAVPQVALDWIIAGKVAASAVAFGLSSILLPGLTHVLRHVWYNLVPIPLLRPVVGGGVVIGLVFLGVVLPDPGSVSIVWSFEPGGAE